MHFEIHVEDMSGKRMLEHLLPRLIDTKKHTYKIHPYKGCGHIPKNLTSAHDASTQMLLNQLPKILQGHGRTFQAYGTRYPAVVIVVVDLDRHCFKEFRQKMLGVLESCAPQPKTQFCIAVEEGEAWLLGDERAIIAAYPKAHRQKLNSYENDSICDTWEKLADIVHPKGSQALKTSDGYEIAGTAKCEWADTITPHMDIENNKSPSFCYFRDKLRTLAQENHS
jgi:hypothetical protein